MKTWVDLLKAYVKGSTALKCPICGKGNISVTDVDTDRGGYLEMKCDDCLHVARFSKRARKK